MRTKPADKRPLHRHNNNRLSCGISELSEFWDVIGTKKGGKWRMRPGEQEGKMTPAECKEEAQRIADIPDQNERQRTIYALRRSDNPDKGMVLAYYDNICRGRMRSTGKKNNARTNEFTAQVSE